MDQAVSLAARDFSPAEVVTLNKESRLQIFLHMVLNISSLVQTCSVMNAGEAEHYGESGLHAQLHAKHSITHLAIVFVLCSFIQMSHNWRRLGDKCCFGEDNEILAFSFLIRRVLRSRI